MDNAGWHARRRAAQSEVSVHTHAAFYSSNVVQEDVFPPARGPDGRFRPVEQVLPLDESFIGGWNVSAPPSPGPSPYPPGYAPNVGGPSAGTPPPFSPSPHLLQSGYPFVHPSSPYGPPVAHSPHPSFDGSQPSHLSAIERSQSLKTRKMNPYLQFMCGPLLRYDTVDERGVWHGAALIVSKWHSEWTLIAARALTWRTSTAADGGSFYEPPPVFAYYWDPDQHTSPRQHHVGNGHSIDLGPHPADPMARPFQSPVEGEHFGPNVQHQTVYGREIYVYSGRGGYVHTHACLAWLQGSCVYISTYTFWRFLIQIPLTSSEMRIKYSINDGMELDFFVPGRSETMRLAAYSVSDPAASPSISIPTKPNVCSATGSALV
jgi:hypothetical protein